MKRFFVVFALASLSFSCEPGYRIYLRNSTSENLYLKTSVSIESLYDKRSTYFDTIINHKQPQQGELNVYLVKPGTRFLIWGYIGKNIVANSLPFDFLSFSGVDGTITLDNKAEIVQHLKREGRKYDYYFFEIE